MPITLKQKLQFNNGLQNTLDKEINKLNLNEKEFIWIEKYTEVVLKYMNSLNF
jgi:hypothetical protein